MKKIVGFSLLIILISFLLLLSKYLVIEEILGFFLFPILIVIVVPTIPYLIIRIFKKISYKKFITNSLVVASVLQLVIVSLILWSATPRYFSRARTGSLLARQRSVGSDDSLHSGLADGRDRLATALGANSFCRVGRDSSRRRSGIFLFAARRVRTKVGQHRAGGRRRLASDG